VTEEWSELLPLGIFHGITTDPVLLEQAGQECTVASIRTLASKALDLPGCNEFMCQTWGLESDGMYSIGMEISELDRERIVVTVPVTYEGTKAASKLIESGVRVCLTVCYSNNQAIIAAGLGAEYIAPYLGRMMDSGKDGVAECKEMKAIVHGMESNTRILVASIRSANTVAALTSSGYVFIILYHSINNISPLRLRSIPLYYTSIHTCLHKQKHMRFAWVFNKN